MLHFIYLMPMPNKTTDHDFWDEIESLYSIGKYSDAKAILDRVVMLSPDSAEGVSARYLRARGYEDGIFSNDCELERAFEDYFILTQGTSELELVSDAFVGLARIMLKQGTATSEEIIAACNSAISIDSNVHALMLIGVTCEGQGDGGDEARKWFLKAWFKGLPWGGRFYANSHIKNRNYIRGYFFHFLSTFFSIILVVIFGFKDPFRRV
jgi:tetratricopeptide (TPR) repeat protein